MHNRPLILTHRGDRVNGIENTIHAVDRAIALGADGIEIDVRQTGSGELVVFHDFSLRRMFDQPGYVGKTDYRQLREMSYINAPDGRTCHIELLDEFLDHFNSDIPINLDAKTIHFFDFEFAGKLISTIHNHRMADRIWISCFNPFLLQILKLKDKRIRTGYLFQRTPLIHNMYDIITYSDAWHPSQRILTEALVNRAKKWGKELYIWTVNDEQVIRRVCGFPVQGIITDNVPLVRKIVDEIY